MTENEAKRYGEEYLHDLTVAVCKVEDRHKNFVRMAIQALEEIQSYRAIGTVEEFKALKEKAEPKKIVYQVGKNGLKHEKCPTCGSFHVFGRYCSECGQKLDLEKENKQ